MQKLIVSAAVFALFVSGCQSGSSSNDSDKNKDEGFVFHDESMSGEALFRDDLTVENGVGPLFNALNCKACHNTPSLGGMGGGDNNLSFRVGYLADGVFTDLTHEKGSPTARSHDVNELGYECSLKSGIPATANVVSVRSAPTLFGLGAIEKIPDEAILAEAIDKGDGIHGRANMVKDSQGNLRVGRFGWKSQKASLKRFVAEAYRNELGMTNTLFPTDYPLVETEGFEECAGYSKKLEMSDEMVDRATEFIASLPVQHTKALDLSGEGFALFKSIGCVSCHKPSYTVDGEEIYLFSDLLIHHMGDGLNDNFPQAQATGFDWRTSPLHGLGTRTHFLHDARTKSIEEAIAEHRGEANATKNRFLALPASDRNTLIEFLKTL